MKVYAVFDTNILVSALISHRSDTAVVLALQTLLSGEVIPLYNDEILQEYEEVLHRERFHLQDGIASERIHTDESFPDPTDLVFYEVALSKEDSFLVTGNNKHFPKNPIVVTPSEFLKLVGKL